MKSMAPVTNAEYRARINSSAVSLSRVPLMIGSQHAAKEAPDPHGQISLVSVIDQAYTDFTDYADQNW
jgi:hypothetical protein